MKVACTDNKTFRLTDNDQFLGELAYKSLFSYEAEITLADANRYVIQSVGFFGTSMAVRRNETEVANLKMNWKGQVVLTFPDHEEFIFKAKGVFRNKYVIENKDEQELIRLTPDFDWRKFNYNYDVSYEEKPVDMLLVLLGVYAANYYIAAMAGPV